MPTDSHPQPKASSHGPLGQTLRANHFPEITDLFFRLPFTLLFRHVDAVHLGDLMRL